MFCPSCAKLSILVTKRTCIRCKGEILNNISCICENCAKEKKVCSVCLKKLSIDQNGQNKFRVKPSCRSCRK